jgi:UrcA family protein
MMQVANKLSPSRFLGTALAALTASLALAGAAHAAGTEQHSVKVAYSDLNLMSDAGTRALYGRITSAAREVCAAADVDNRDLRGLAVERQCENRAIAGAVASVHSSRLAALYGNRTSHG